MKTSIPKLTLKRLKSGMNKQGRPQASTLSAGTPAGSGAMKPIDPKWAWHYCVLLKLRDRLLKDKGDQLGQVAEPLEPHGMSIADSATDEFDHDLALALLSTQQDALNEVDEAIRRIVDGTYGICLETGTPIPRARLRAIPWTRFLKEVEAHLEAIGVASHAHIGDLGSVRPPPPGRLVKTETPQEETD